MSEWLALTQAQQGIWFAMQQAPQRLDFNTGEWLTIEGDLDPAALSAALEQLWRQTPSLTLCFTEHQGVPRQRPSGRPAPKVQAADFRGASDPLLAGQAWARQLIRAPYPPEGEDWIRLGLARLGERSWGLVLAAHHLVLDGYGYGLLIQSLGRLYLAACQGAAWPASRQPALALLLAQEQAYLASDQAQADSTYWQAQMADWPMPAALTAAAGGTGLGGDEPLVLQQRWEGPLWQRIVDTAAGYGLGEQEWLCALFALYLHRWSGEAALSLCLPQMCRRDAVSLQSAGVKVNLLPLRVQFAPGLTLAQLAAQVRQGLSALRRHQQWRYEALLRLCPSVAEGQEAPFGPQLNFLPFTADLRWGALTLRQQTLASGPVPDLALFFTPDAQGMLCRWEADPKRYDQALLARHQARFAQLVQQACAAPAGQLVATLPWLLAEDWAEQASWQGASRPVPPVSLSQLFEAQVSRTPDAEALVYEDQRLSYRQLNEAINRLAHLLLAQGVTAGDRVAVALPRSLELVISLHAIHKCGAAYLPLDPDYPPARLQDMLSRSAPRLLIQFARQPVLPEADTPQLRLGDPAVEQALAMAPSHNPAPAPEAGQLPAYVIYTSGSTGRPKGVVVGQAAIVNRLLWMQRAYPLAQGDRVLQKTPSGFDVSVWEFFWPLQTGAALVMARPGGHKDPGYLSQLIGREAISCLHFVPSMLALFLQEGELGSCGSLRLLFCSGEALPATVAQETLRRLPALALHNLYGPTEAAVDVTYWPCARHETEVPIGRPIDNLECLVLDPLGQPLPAGACGELYLGGTGLAEGYLFQPELTAERFVPHPLQPGARLYRTGDLACWRADGALLYLGRCDFQVKIRGQRMELGEVEHQLAALPAVAQVAVLAREDRPGDQRLVAYLVARQATLDDEAVRAALSAVLPEFMVPSAFVWLAALPLSANGKLDRRALPAPTYGSSDGRAPASEQEAALCRAFAEILGRDSVGPDEHFFLNGGHSLLAARLISQLRQQGAQSLTLAQLFAHPTPAALARQLTGTGQDDDDGLGVLFCLRRGDPAERPLFCVHPAGGISWCYSPLLKVLPTHLPLYGLQARGLRDGEDLPQDMTAMALDYLAQLRQIQPTGPYRLIGWSIGGMIAHHLACLLQQQGEQVELLGLLDAYPSDQWRQLPAPEEQEICQALLRMASLDENQWSGPWQRDAVFERLLQPDSALACLEARHLAAFVAVVINNRRLFTGTAHLRFDGDLLFFNAALPRSETWLSPLDWQPYVGGRILQHDIACQHQHMIKAGPLSQIGEQLGQALGYAPLTALRQVAS
ncbi:amino acid adenylation domain-containing protein [Pseudaeromonas sp. ZJS20]|uniref:amino acid adenylation domain-containing protein n=1 Tax=Pseudaeromonas aegiceratis TaxID=3153928 RepID=UPI00390C6329